MAIYVNKNNELVLPEPLTRECPHCGAHAQLMPVATAPFETIARTRPKHVGLVFRCAACNEPRFLRASVRAIENERAELGANLLEVERSRERFQFGYVPEPLERLLRETLECYSAGVYTAFAMMCRRVTSASLAVLDANAKRRWQDATAEVLRIGDVDESTSAVVEAVLFGEGETPVEVAADEAAVLIEVVKDLFYQSFVRTAKLRAAIRMRRFFAGEGARNVTRIDRGRRELA
jgi:hypothetical protein